MSDPASYHLPEFVLNELKNSPEITENDLAEISHIYIRSADFTYPSANTEANLQKVMARMVSTETAPVLTYSKRTSLSIIFRWSVAAILVLTLSIGIFQYYNSGNKAQPVAFSTGEKHQKIVLMDGTEVILNSYSAINSDAFSENKRTLILKGEAYFNVVHNDHPFTIVTESGSIHVLGTKFNVKNRKNMPFQVALSSGRISLTTDKGEFMLAPGDVITRTPEGQYVKSALNNNSLGWLEDKLVFENESLANIVAALESQYNVKLVYDEKLKSEKLTLTFHQLNAIQAAELLSKTLNSKVEVK